MTGEWIIRILSQIFLLNHTDQFWNSEHLIIDSVSLVNNSLDFQWINWITKYWMTFMILLLCLYGLLTTSKLQSPSEKHNRYIIKISLCVPRKKERVHMGLNQHMGEYVMTEFSYSSELFL